MSLKTRNLNLNCRTKIKHFHRIFNEVGNVTTYLAKVLKPDPVKNAIFVRNPDFFLFQSFFNPYSRDSFFTCRLNFQKHFHLTFNKNEPFNNDQQLLKK